MLPVRQEAAAKRYLILDTETTTKAKGNPFCESNRLCYIGAKFVGEQKVTIANLLDDTPNLSGIQAMLDSADYLVAFNAKFDCHWLERAGLKIDHLRIFDCQYAEFIFERQLKKYPSLEEAAIKYELGHKLDVVKEEYWKKGVDTLDIPSEVMVQYLEMDVLLTEKLFTLQMQLFQTTKKGMWRLFQLHMEDQHCLRAMEHNGILYDTEKSLEAEKQCDSTIADINKKLLEGYESIPINFGSSEQVSAYLFGGTIAVETRVPIGVYKTGAKAGQPRNKVVVHEYKLPRLIEPLPKTELKKSSEERELWSTDESVLRQLKGAREAKARISLLNERSKQEKLRGTYYGGFPKKLLEMEWGGNMLHPSLNQCVASTGRLSSTNPNGQNQPGESKRLCVSRY